MEVDFYRHGEEGAAETIVGHACWTGHDVEVTGSADDVAASVVKNIFRRTPVVVDDAALRSSSGQHGVSVIQPGSYEWFRTAAICRAPKVGLSVRFVSEVAVGEGWDPAAQYREFREVVERQA